MHARLFFSMLCHLPKYLYNRPDYHSLQLPKTKTWSNLDERGTLYGLWLLAVCYRFLGRYVCLILGTPVVLYFYLTGHIQRRSSQLFLQRVWKKNNTKNKLPYYASLFHFMNFFAMTLDKFAAWTGQLDINNLIGCLFIFREICLKANILQRYQKQFRTDGRK